MGANKSIEDIEASLLAATKSALLVRLRKILVTRRSNLAGFREERPVWKLAPR
jgi:hypothetical protein